MKIEQQYYNILWHKQPDGISKKEKQIEDLKKAIWYIKREIKHLSNGEE